MDLPPDRHNKGFPPPGSIGHGPDAIKNLHERKEALVQAVVEEMREQMDSLRVSVTYLAFDVEATKRERDRAVADLRLQAEQIRADRMTIDRQRQVIASLRQQLRGGGA